MIAAASSVTVRFGDTVALENVSVELTDGTILAAVGGDGAGKTTLLRALAREVVCDSGTITSPDKQHLGYLPAGPGCWAALTVRENLDFVGEMYGLRGDELVARRDEMIKRAGLTVATDRPAGALSGGMRRKLATSMALIHRPRLVILDEPSTGVDPVSRIDLWRMISESAAAGSAVIMSTTYLDEAERAAQLLVLDEGRTLAQGSYADVRAGFTGIITSTPHPIRREWSWRRGRERHEYWPEDSTERPSAGATTVDPDLEDIVISLSLRRQLVSAGAR